MKTVFLPRQGLFWFYRGPVDTNRNTSAGEYFSAQQGRANVV
ncbi:hypothetical protein [Agarilytica rhodophyticola]|nr:hypothetical protein [Agarilytica rhodophyticola]